MTQAQYDALLLRVTSLEISIAQIFTAINQLPSIQQVNSLNMEVQTELEALSTQLASITSRITALEEESYL